MKVGYKTIPFAMNRRMAAASAAVASERNTIHGITISEPRRIMREYRQQTGERRSLTACVTACLARVVVSALEKLYASRGISFELEESKLAT
jgi:hypothetical protein